ncbi:MAG TPA: hypothetical protein VMI92_12740 [Steroidobacteraceae bacterium]|nr:hypothetical protein [Steroidobacteraceae bacterium]
MRNSLLIALALLPAAGHAAPSPAAAYFGNSLLCKAASTGAVCQLWLDENGKYAVFYDSGKKAYVKGVDGPFQYEGRQGTYTASAVKDGLKVCLKPEADHPPRPRGASPALFHDAGCVTLPTHATGELWDFSYQGETYKMGLIKGR